MRSTLFTAGRYSYSYNFIHSVHRYLPHSAWIVQRPWTFSRLFHVYTYICRYGPMPILIGR